MNLVKNNVIIAYHCLITISKFHLAVNTGFRETNIFN